MGHSTQQVGPVMRRREGEEREGRRERGGERGEEREGRRERGGERGEEGEGI